MIPIIDLSVADSEKEVSLSVLSQVANFSSCLQRSSNSVVRTVTIADGTLSVKRRSIQRHNQRETPKKGTTLAAKLRREVQRLLCHCMDPMCGAFLF